MSAITKETARAIACAHIEVENADNLLAELRKALADKREPDFRDAFGRQHRKLQLSIPNSSSNSHRLLDVSPPLAIPVIEASRAQQVARIVELSQVALIEAGAVPETPAPTASVLDDEDALRIDAIKGALAQVPSDWSVEQYDKHRLVTDTAGRREIIMEWTNRGHDTELAEEFIGRAPRDVRFLLELVHRLDSRLRLVAEGGGHGE